MLLRLRKSDVVFMEASRGGDQCDWAQWAWGKMADILQMESAKIAFSWQKVYFVIASNKKYYGFINNWNTNAWMKTLPSNLKREIPVLILILKVFITTVNHD